MKKKDLLLASLALLLVAGLVSRRRHHRPALTPAESEIVARGAAVCAKIGRGPRCVNRLEVEEFEALAKGRVSEPERQEWLQAKKALIEERSERAK